MDLRGEMGHLFLVKRVWIVPFIGETLSKILKKPLTTSYFPRCVSTFEEECPKGEDVRLHIFTSISL